MTLALLLTAATGAWAADTYTVQFKANGNTKTVENITLPHTFSCNQDDETGRGTDELDVIIQELYGLSGTYCLNTAPNSDNASVTCGMDGADYQYIIVSAPFNGTATVTGKYIDSNYNVFDYTLEISFAEPSSGIDVTTNAASAQDLFTEAKFNMPAFDATVDYLLVRDMQDEANPVTFSGLPSSGNIVVKKGDDGKYQPAEALTIQLIDPLAAADAQNIIAADGITVKVLVGDDSSLPIEYDHISPITLDDFLADMKPGYYWIKAESTDENSPYDGTVYSSEFTVVEQYDLTVKPANDFSKGKIESVTVGTETVTPDATTGEATKTGIAPDTEVKLKAKRGYVIEKVEAKKTGPAEGHALTSAKFGEIVGSDGKAYAADDKDNLPSGVTAAAKVCYVDGNGHGLALALTDEVGNMNWSTAQTVCDAHTPAITGGKWMLASKGEWSNMINAAGSYSALRDGFSSVGGTNMVLNDYWSSTEDGSSFNNAWCYSFFGGFWYSDGKADILYGRACLAF